jgi:hypothetical protein
MPPYTGKDLPEKLQVALKTVIDHFEQEDRSVRERQIRLWKKMEMYWAGFQRLWWSEVAHDWRVFDTTGTESNGSDESAYYDKPINVFRAYLETIIAALSITVPTIKCAPDDADNINDILTAKGGTNIAQLVYDHIDAPLLWCKALFIYCTQGMVAAYNYPAEDERYGFVDVAEYKDNQEEVDVKKCPECGTVLNDPNVMSQAIDSELNEVDEYMPEDDDVVLHNDILNKQQILCPTCQIKVDPELAKDKVTITRMAGITRKPKTRQCIEVNGGLYIKVPNYAREQKDTPYLAYCYETHFSNVYKKYPHLREKMAELDSRVTSGSGYDVYERWGRLSTQYYGEYPLNTPTVRNWWLRPSAFEVISDDDTRDELYKKFPDGAKVVYINEEYADSENESLDDCWTLTYNPLSNYIHFDPAGLLLTSIQEITNDLISLKLQTIEHGIPQTFADPGILNFEQYKNTEVSPGTIFPARAKSGKSMQDGFYTISTATLSQEVAPFSEEIQELGQFVSGALPSLFGGNVSNSSRTAAQYSMSRAQAMQRLQTPWKMFNFWWKNIFAKVIPAYMKTMLEDERLVKPMGDSWVNVVIHKAQLDGKIGNVTIESSETLPHGWGQSEQALMQLLQTQNPQILQWLAAPENLGVWSELLGLPNLTIPGEDDREKQIEEIQTLIKAAPVPGAPIMVPQQPGMPPQPPQPGPPQPSVMPELMVDNHAVEADICRNWLVSETGRQCKIENPNGYQNVLLHLQAHVQMLQQLNAPPPMPANQGPPPNQQQQGPPRPQGPGRLLPIKPPMQQPMQQQQQQPPQGNANGPG